MGNLTYTRGTTYYLTHTYTAPQYLGATLIFTAKSVPFDADAPDTLNAIMPPKRITMTGSAFPQTTVIKIAPADIAVTVAPAANYSYSLKVIDSNADGYICDYGTFVLKATTTNEVS